MTIPKIFMLGLAAWQPPNPSKCVLDKGITRAEASATLCGFDSKTLTFAGTPEIQARCLTRHVAPEAEIQGEELPDSLATIVGKNVQFSTSKLADYLRDLKVLPEEVGGAVTDPLEADYFIIHDTSTPNCSNLTNKGEKLSSCDRLDEFPKDRDTGAWITNRTFGGRPKRAPNRKANVYVNRVGKSVTEVLLSDQAFFTTKFEQCENDGVAIGRFIGVENIQPRLPSKTPPASRTKMNDVRAPDPGFTDAQYDRLALIYVVASARHGRWLIPAYHAVIDSFYLDKHDDPQKFAILKFSAAVAKYIGAVKKLGG